MFDNEDIEHGQSLQKFSVIFAEWIIVPFSTSIMRAVT